MGRASSTYLPLVNLHAHEALPITPIHWFFYTKIRIHRSPRATCHGKTPKTLWENGKTMTVPGLLVLLAQRPPFFAHVEEILRRPADSVIGWRACISFFALVEEFCRRPADSVVG